MSWQADKRWSDAFLPEMKSILGLYLIGEATMDEDRHRNTDLIVLKMEAVRIACRVRKFNYLTRYADEFTIRCERPSGVKSEMAKILEGWGDYFFYGFADQAEHRLAAWFLGDLKVFRLWVHQQSLRLREMPGQERTNGDGSSKFRAFQCANMPTAFFRARKEAEARPGLWVSA